MRRALTALCFLALLVAWPAAMTKDDFEEVNFAFDSAVLVDGFPSMLRLADILERNPSFSIKVVGHCDAIGSNAYNDKLALKRADAVRDFLIKYGARPDQVEAVGMGKREPEAPNNTREGRFMNRRVVFTLYRTVDGKKEAIRSFAPISDVLKELQKYPLADKIDAIAAKQDAILDKLARLDDLDKVLDELRDLKDKQARMEDELARLRDQLRQQGPAEKLAVAPPPPPPLPPAPPAPPALPRPELKPLKPEIQDLSLMNFDLGTTDQGDLTGTFGARYFHRFSDTFALQSQGEYLLFPERQEFQFDLGFVKRYLFFQMGGFASVKRVELDMFHDGGTLAQGTAMAEFLFDGGSVGGFATHALIRESVVDREPLANHLFRESYLQTLDQYGVTFQLGVPWRESFFEGNVGYINRPDRDNKVGGLVRFVSPINEHWSWYAEGGWNETLISSDTTGRFAVGIRLGEWKKPVHNGDTAVTPLDVPRLRYDVRTRLVKTGNDIPIADAGPDQVGVEAGTIRLDGSASYDPDGDEITLSWTQVQGPPVSLSGADTATPSFEAEEGQVYVFRLRVTDSTGAYAYDTVVVSTKKTEQVEVLFFLAEPATVAAGQPARLSWKVINAETVAIEGIGPVQPEGNVTVTPTQTTTYTLVASGGGRDVTATAVVEVAGAEVLFFNANPSTITAGGQADLSWQVANAESVEIEGIGPVQDTGSVTVSPAETTTYTLVARGGGREVTATAVVTVSSANRAPVAYAGPYQATSLPGTITLDGSGSFDPDGDPITYHWRQIAGPSVTLSDPNSAVTTFELSTRATYIFELVVTDNKGATGSDRVRVLFY